MDNFSCNFCDDKPIVKLTTLEQGKLDTYFFCNQDLKDFKCKSQNFIRVNRENSIEYIPSLLKNVVKKITEENLQDNSDENFIPTNPTEKDIIDSVLRHVSEFYDEDDCEDDYYENEESVEECVDQKKDRLAKELTLEDKLRYSIESEDFIEAARIRDLMKEKNKPKE